MTKVITLSRTFPAYHPKAGQPTHFVEKIWKSLQIDDDELQAYWEDYNSQFEEETPDVRGLHAKHHTIRAGKRWKDGDMASLRVWSGRPYNSPQIAIAPDVKLTVKDVEIDDEWNTFIDGKYLGYYYAGDIPQKEIMINIAQNDGLHYQDLIDWFPKLPFSGQMLIWNNNNLPY